MPSSVLKLASARSAVLAALLVAVLAGCKPSETPPAADAQVVPDEDNTPSY